MIPNASHPARAGGRAPSAAAASPGDDARFTALRCPHCLGPFRSTLRRGAFALVRCACREHPVVTGVLFLDLASAAPLRKLIRQGDDAGIERLLAQAFRIPPSLTRGPVADLEQALAELHRLRPDATEWLHHIRHFYATPNYLAMLALGPVFERISPARLLDIGCGAGNFAYLAASRARPASVTLLDLDPAHLLIAKALLSEFGEPLCVACDAGRPLPFPDNAFDAVISSDALHYIPGRGRVLAEIERVTAPEGGVLLTHLHNRDGADPCQGESLAWAQWRELTAAQGRPGLLLSDEQLRREVRGLRGERHREVPAAERCTVPSFTWAAGSCAPAYLSTRAAPPTGPGPLHLNPIYRAWGDGRLRRCDPSPAFAREFAYPVPPTWVDPPAPPEDPREVDRLWRNQVLVELPSLYRPVRAEESGR